MQAQIAPLHALSDADRRTSFNPDKLQIILWKWKTPARYAVGVEYGPDHIHRMRNMLSRNLDLPHEITVITDDPSGIDPDIRVLPIWDDYKDAGYCFVRLKAFKAEMSDIIGPRFLWLDLDMVIVDDVTALFDCPGVDFKISGVELRAQPYNGSIVLMDAGARPQVYSDFDIDRYRRELKEKRYGGSDQAWIAICLGENEQIWTEKDGIYNYRDTIWEGTEGHTGGTLPGNAKIISFNSRRFDPSMPEIQTRCPWILEHWR